MDIDKVRGSLIGLAIGDALGAPVEMCLPGTFEHISGMHGGGYFKLAPGEWTDDTALALCSAESLIVQKMFDPQDHLTRFLKWYRQGYMSTRNEALGVGLITAAALLRFETTGENFCGPTGEQTAHNGSLMCLAPVVLAHAYDYALAISRAKEFSRLTHAAPVAVDACGFLAHCIVNSLRGLAKQEIIHRYVAVTQEIKELTAQDLTTPPIITAQNYANAKTTLHAALWAFWTTTTFEEGMLQAVNLGWDADTTGAVYGQLAGTFYGLVAIPSEWHEAAHRADFIEQCADALLALAHSTQAQISIGSQ